MMISCTNVFLGMNHDGRLLCRNFVGFLDGFFDRHFFGNLLRLLFSHNFLGHFVKCEMYKTQIAKMVCDKRVLRGIVNDKL